MELLLATRRRAAFIVVGVMVACLAVPAAATTATADRLSVLRAAAATGRVAAMLAATAGIDPGPPAPRLRVLDAVAALDQAVATAMRAVRQAVPADARADVAAAAARLGHGAVGDALGVVPPKGTEGEATFRPDIADLAGRVDRAAITLAAVSVARSIDAVLGARPRALTIGAIPAAPCDVVSLAPHLCVSSEGDHSYPASMDYWTTVDLGGNDAWTQAAGAAIPCAEPLGGRPEGCVRVALDIAGNDTWTASGAHPVVAQGVGFSGVGLVVDGGGDDTYTIAPSPAECATGTCASAIGQGYGYVGGVGALADLGGADVYEVTMPVTDEQAQGDVATTAGVQGASNFGLGMLADAGVGNDRYGVSGPATGWPMPVNSVYRFETVAGSGYQAQGVAFGGPGVLLDGGGNDDLSVHVAPRPGAGAATPGRPFGEGSGVAFLAAQGYAVDGSSYGHSGGYVVTGNGPTRYTVDVRGRMSVTVAAQGRGAEENGIDDVGGDDVYRVGVGVSGEIAAACNDCPEAVVDLLADPLARALPAISMVIVSGQGSAGGGVNSSATSRSTVHDHGGDDRYEVVADASLLLQATGPNRAAAMARDVGFMSLCVQGCAGSLIDDRGNDVYRTATSQHLETVAQGAEPSATALVRGVEIQAQGAALGRLTDGGGRDTYAITRDVGAHATPGGSADEGTPLYVRGQGAGAFAGSLEDVDAGDADTFVLDAWAATASCDGRAHGKSPGWAFGFDGRCPSTATATDVPGAAVVSSAAERSGAPQLTLSAERIGREDAAVTVQLTDADGSPLPGRRVSVYVAGMSRGALSATTGPQGTATGDIIIPPEAATVRAFWIDPEGMRLPAAATVPVQPAA